MQTAGGTRPYAWTLPVRARVASKLRVDLRGDVSFVGWDIVCLGRPSSAEPFEEGVFDRRLSVWRDDLPLWVDHALFEGGGTVLVGENPGAVSTTMV